MFVQVKSVGSDCKFHAVPEKKQLNFLAKVLPLDVSATCETSCPHSPYLFGIHFQQKGQFEAEINENLAFQQFHWEKYGSCQAPPIPINSPKTSTIDKIWRNFLLF